MLFYLMHKDQKVLKADISVCYNMLSGFVVEELYNKSLLPINMKQKNNDFSSLSDEMYYWWKTRYYDAKRNYFHIISNQLGCEYRNRNYLIHQSNSFFTHAASLLDYYWLNPVEPVFVDKGVSDGLVTFMVNPSTWDKVNFENKPFSEEVGEMIMECVANPYYMKHFDRESIDLNTPNLTLPGIIPKRWIRIDGKLFCEKMYENSEKGICASNKQIEIGKIIKEINPAFAINYTSDPVRHNICRSERFLGADEEFVSAMILAKAFVNKNSKKLEKSGKTMLNIDDILSLAHTCGCSNKMLKDYKKTIESLREEIGSNLPFEKYIENIGFVMDGKTMNIVRPAPIFGSTW